jgi:branched-chain amino acid transport system ATP-binding protein
MTAPLLAVNGLTKQFGGFTALADISMHVMPGERLGLIGPNGSGKTTLVNCISGTLPISAGSVTLDDRRIDGLPPHQRARLGLVRSFQLPRPFGSLTVADNLRVATVYAGRTGAAGIPDMLEMVGLKGKADRLPRELTQIEMRKLELARAMAASPRLLIVVVALLLQLSAQGVTIIMIEHIMRAVMTFSQRLICVVAGRKVADGNPDEVTANPEVLKAYLGE